MIPFLICSSVGGWGEKESTLMSETSRRTASGMTRFLKRFPIEERADVSALVAAIGLQQVLCDCDVDSTAASPFTSQQLLSRIRALATADAPSLRRVGGTSRHGSFRHGSSANRLRVPSARNKAQEGGGGSSPRIAGSASGGFEDFSLGPLARTVPCPSDDEPDGALTPPSPLSANPLSLMSEDDRSPRSHHQAQKETSGFAKSKRGSALAFIAESYVAAAAACQGYVQGSSDSDNCVSAFSMKFIRELRRKIVEDRGAKRDLLVLAAHLPSWCRQHVLAPRFDELYRSLLIAYHLEGS